MLVDHGGFGEEAVFGLRLEFFNFGVNTIVAGVGPVIDLAEGPECRRFRPGDHGSVSHGITFGDLAYAAVHGGVYATVGIVDAEPEDASHGVGES